MKPQADPSVPKTCWVLSRVADGTTVPMASKFSVVTKSPLTRTWGDANTGGWFGHEVKAAGYDALFFSGISPEPVYLWVHDGKAEIRSAARLWGKDTFETEDLLHGELGDKRARIVRIGPSGERLSLISSVVSDRGGWQADRAWGR